MGDQSPQSSHVCLAFLLAFASAWQKLVRALLILVVTATAQVQTRRLQAVQLFQADPLNLVSPVHPQRRHCKCYVQLLLFVVEGGKLLVAWLTGSHALSQMEEYEVELL